MTEIESTTRTAASRGLASRTARPITKPARARARASRNPYRAFDELLAALHPRHAKTKRTVELEPDVPARMRLVWEAIGFSDATTAIRPPWLARAASERELARVFHGWTADPRSRARWGETEAAYRAALPERARVVGLGWKDEVAFTDESGGADDPPVLVMRQRETPVVRWYERYSEWLVWELLTTLTVDRQRPYDRRAKLPSVPLLAKEYPGLYRLADGVWRIEAPASSRRDVSPTFDDLVFYSSYERCFAFAWGLPEAALRAFRPPQGASVEVATPGPIDLFENPPSGFRVFDQPRRGSDKQREALGRVGAAGVSLHMFSNGNLTVTFDPKQTTVVRRWLNKQKAKIVSERSMRPGYDKHGW